MAGSSAAATWGGPMSSAQPRPIKKVRAIIFSCHNPHYFENTIEPKLERYHIEMVRKIDPNRQSTVNLADCDVVLLLLELMPSQHVQLIRSQCRLHGKELIVLHRQVSDWERAFARKEDQKIAGAVKPISRDIPTEPRIPSKIAPPPAPNHSLPPPATKEPLAMWGKEDPTHSRAIPANEENIEPEGISPEYAEWLSLLESENTRQAAEIRELTAKWKRAAEEHEQIVTKNVELDRKNKELMERIKASETRESKFQSEMTALKQSHNREVNELKDLLKKVGEELEKVGKGAVGVVSDIEKALQHFEEIWKMGVMDAEEILKKLFHKAKK